MSQMMYESMKVRVEHAVDKGKVSEEYIATDQEREAFNKWAAGNFTRQDHPTVIQVKFHSSLLIIVQAQQNLPNSYMQTFAR